MILRAYKIFIFGLLTICLFLTENARAECNCYFTWYCSACSKIGAHTTGQNGPFATLSSCESAANAMAGSMKSMGGGLDSRPTCSCSSNCGSSSTSSAQGGYQGGRTAQTSTQYQPQLSYQDQGSSRYEYYQKQLKEDARRKEEANKRIQAAKEKFAKDKADLLKTLKLDESAELKITSGTDFFRIKGNPDSGIQLKNDITQAQARTEAQKRFSCAEYLTDCVFTAANAINLAEVHFLGGEIQKALAGDQLNVECKYDLRVPEIKGVEANPDKPIAIFYQNLVRILELQTKRIEIARKKISNIGLNPDESRPVLVKKIKKLISETPVTDEPPVSETEVKVKKKDRKALKAALEALKDAQDAENKRNQCLNFHNTLEQDLGQAIGLTQKLVELKNP